MRPASVSFSLTSQPNTTSSAAALYFGESLRAPSLPNRDHLEDDAHSSPQQRKHARESTINGLGLVLPTTTPNAKRNRRGDGNVASINGNGYHYQNHAPPEPQSPTNYSPGEDCQNGMDIDEDHDATASPSPNDQLILTLDHGESVGVQSEKVAELGPHTNILTMPGKAHIEHTTWHQRDPNVLAVSSFALTRIWFTSNQESHVDISTSSQGTTVTTMEWSPSGDVLAVATHGGDHSSIIHLWSKTGVALEGLNAGQNMVLTICWSPSGDHLMGITYSDTGASSLVLWEVQNSQPLSSYSVPNTITGAVWTAHNQFTICGHSVIASSLLEDWKILTMQSRSEPAVSQRWSHVRYDSRTHTTALAAEDSGFLGVIDSSDMLHTIKAHDAEITALAYQPIINHSAYPANAPRLLATSSTDGTIIVWDAKRPFVKVHTLHLGSATPVMAMSFTPDGYLIAAANENRVLIWNAEAGGVPKASWRGFLDKLPNGSSLTNGDGIDVNGTDGDAGAPFPTMGWNSDGGKLALSSGNQVREISKAK